MTGEKGFRSGLQRAGGRCKPVAVESVPPPEGPGMTRSGSARYRRGEWAAGSAGANVRVAPRE